MKSMTQTKFECIYMVLQNLESVTCKSCLLSVSKIGKYLSMLYSRTTHSTKKNYMINHSHTLKLGK